MMPNEKKWFTWKLEITIHKTWVEDGFDVQDDDVVQDMLMKMLPYATSAEVKGKVLERPEDAAVAECQGYKSINEYLKHRNGVGID